MHKPFEQLTLLVDQFYQQNEQPVKRGAKPRYDNKFYLKLYFFGILNRCPEKVRFLSRAEREYPRILKKPAQSTVLRRLSLIEPDARQFWRWLQAKLRREGLVELEDVLLDATTLEPVLFARVNESVLERFKGCNFGKKVVEKRWFFGRKVHLLSTPNGTLISFRLTAGNIHDRRVFHRIVKPENKEVTADSGCRGVKRAKGQKLSLTKPFSPEKRQRQLNGKRVGIERVFTALKNWALSMALLLKPLGHWDLIFWPC